MHQGRGSVDETEFRYCLGNTSEVFEYKLKGRAEENALTSSCDSARIGCAVLPSEVPAGTILYPLLPTPPLLPCFQLLVFLLTRVGGNKEVN